MLAACLCCRKKVPKNELLGLEGMVKIKNPDEQVIIVTADGASGAINGQPSLSSGSTGSGACPSAQPAASTANNASKVSCDPNLTGSASFENEKRISNAPHRSLPDIPVSDGAHMSHAAAVDQIDAASVAAGVGGSASNAAADNGSDLYATVGDKPAANASDPVQHGNSDRVLANQLRKLASISQHSSLSQADDASSPYARVKSMTNHAYDKLRTTEHPYAQLTTAGPSAPAAASAAASASDSAARADEDSLRGLPGSSNSSHENIAAASAIAGRVSASQELPYMTPPIVPPQALLMQPPGAPPMVGLPPPNVQQHFSGDSQDSSKGYTSISVREPLANIRAQQQQNVQQQHQQQQHNAQQRRRDMTDSHYATVSDDSDEMYAAIEDPNNHGDLYTSGSETYAQIQPPPQAAAPPGSSATSPGGVSAISSAVAASHMVPITVAVEINAPSAASGSSLTPRMPVVDEDAISILTSAASKRHSVISGSGTVDHQASILPNVDILRNVVHSRQASSSSCTSSVGNLGSPKPEKRQANSPLPPTPKSSAPMQSTTANANLASSGSASSNVANMPAGQATLSASGRNSVTSVVGDGLLAPASHIGNSRHVSRENLSGSMDAQMRSHSRLSMSGSTTTMDDEAGSAKKRNSAKNLEGMYAKVMKKNKLSNAPSQNTSPIPYRKSYTDVANGVALNALPAVPTVDSVTSALSRSMHIGNDYETISEHQRRSSAGAGLQKKDPEYETIPADSAAASMRFSAGSSAGQLAHEILANMPAPVSPTAHITLTPASITVVSVGGGSDPLVDEPGYESLPDQHVIDPDPGYEILHTKQSLRRNPSSSDYDPNYEVLRHNNNNTILCTGETNDYAKVWQTAGGATRIAFDEENTLNDGYSSIRTTAADSVPEALLPVATSPSASIKIPILPAKAVFHDYAQIGERHHGARTFLLGTAEPIGNNGNESPATVQPIDSTSELYSSLTTSRHGNSATDSPAASDPNYSTIPETIAVVRDESQSPARSTSATVSSSPPGSGDSSTIMLDDSIDVPALRKTTVHQQHSYDSLTGSESDPNYESVRYTISDSRNNNVSLLSRTENPYERLYSSNAQSAQGTLINDQRTSTHPMVDDYFQV